LNSEFDFEGFVETELKSSRLKIIPASENYCLDNLEKILSFINTNRNEYAADYGWRQEAKEYILNPLQNKFKFSYVISNETDEICFLNFTSVYDKILHNHCTYTSSVYRNKGLAKLHMIKLCSNALNSGFEFQEGFWPVNNNRSLILFLQMGWQLDSIGKDTQVKMIADNKIVRQKAYELYHKTKLR